MGMFDYVRCEVELPDGFTGELQTKDLQCDLVTHVIREDGRLVVEQMDWRLTVKSQHVSDFHGWLNFYGGSHGDWHEYRAKFTDGHLVKIEQVEDQ